MFVSEKGPKGDYLLRQDANVSRISYNFQLTQTDENGSNDYFDVYKFACDDPAGVHSCKDEIMNPENTFFESDVYSRHFAENW